MLCPNCEFENRDGAKFCDECGFPLAGALARAGGAASPVRTSSDRDDSRSSDNPSTRNDYAGYQPSLLKPQPAPVEDTHEPHDQFDYYDQASADTRIDSSPSYEYESVAYDRYGSGSIDPAPYEEDYAPSEAEYQGQTHQAETPQEPVDPYLDPYAEYRSGYHPEARDPYPSQPLPDDPYEFHADEYVYEERVEKQSTMQMPRLDQGGQPANRDFRAFSDTRSHDGRKIALIIVAAVAVVAIAIAVAVFALGLFGGKPVPDVTGMTEAEARTLLEEEGFTVRSTQVKSDDTEGLVLIMDPKAGSRAPEGSEVVIHIATTRFIPDVVGLSEEEARKLFDEAGYENVKYELERSSGPEGIVLSTSPEGGTRAKSSMEVLVRISEPYKVPDISGKSLDDAMKAIEDAGLVPEIVYIDTDQYADGEIIGTNPQAGTKVSEGDYVGISVARTRGIELVGLTEAMFAPGNTVTIAGVDYEIESIISMSYLGDDTVDYTATARPKITFFGETLYASSSQTISGQVIWSSDNEVISIG